MRISQNLFLASSPNRIGHIDVLNHVLAVLLSPTLDLQSHPPVFFRGGAGGRSQYYIH